MTHVECMVDAERQLTEHAVDIILLDPGLPDSQGLDAVRRTHAAASHVPLIRLPILYAEDDQDNWLLMHLAHLESVVKHPIVFVSDGREVIEYLCGTGR